MFRNSTSKSALWMMSSRRGCSRGMRPPPRQTWASPRGPLASVRARGSRRARPRARVDVGVEDALARAPAEQLHAADLDDAIPQLGVQVRSFRYQGLSVSAGIPRLASLSARSFSGCPAWPRTSAILYRAWRRARRGAATGRRSSPASLSAVRQRAASSRIHCDAFHHVERVGVEPDPARALQRLQRADRGHELHAIVGRRRLAAPELFSFPS